MGLIRVVLLFVPGILRNRVDLAAENVALRQQLAVLREKVKRPRVRNRDRIFWAIRSRVWADWRSALLIVQPDTVVRWHRQGFKLFWQWKSRMGKVGRPSTEAEIRQLIRRMSRENPSWGIPRIQSELALLGHRVSDTTVRKYRIRHRNPPSQTWRTFLDNHLTDIVATDFFTVPTAAYNAAAAKVNTKQATPPNYHTWSPIPPGTVSGGCPSICSSQVYRDTGSVSLNR